MRKIGEGDKSEVFALDGGRVLKLFRPQYASLAPVEYGICRSLAAAGVPAPKVESLTEHDSRPGLIFCDLPVGTTLSRAVRARPWQILAMARDLAALHAAVHERSSAELPSQRERLIVEINGSDAVADDVRRGALAVLHDLPDARVVCHMDVHMLNAIVHPGGLVLIDWVLAASGNPLADVAAASLQLRFGELPAQPLARAALDMGRRVFWRAYLRRYLELRGTRAPDVVRWELPVAVALAGRRAGRMRRQLVQRIEELRGVEAVA